MKVGLQAPSFSIFPTDSRVRVTDKAGVIPAPFTVMRGSDPRITDFCYSPAHGL
jgi:hypothetical protein